MSGSRRGMTLVEMLVGLMVTTIILGALVTTFVSQSQLTGEQNSQRVARGAARSAAQALAVDIRRIESAGGVEQAAADSITIRIPFALGLVCASTGSGGGSTVISLFPADSANFANAAMSGFAWRDQAGSYTYVPATGLAAGAASTCSSASITTLPGGSVVEAPAGSGGIPAGSPVFLYQRVRYAFAPTGAGLSLVRTKVETGASETLVEPFDSAATRFRFYVGTSAVPEDAPPVDLGDLTGIELVLEGLGDRPRVRDGSVATAPLSATVFFKNRTP